MTEIDHQIEQTSVVTPPAFDWSYDCSATSAAMLFGYYDRIGYNNIYTGPTVTINQAGGQADPTNTSPVNFTVVFSESVSDFTTGDVTLSGTTGAPTPR